MVFDTLRRMCIPLCEILVFLFWIALVHGN